MPLFFAGRAICPMAIMPDWLKVVARVNALTCAVDTIRALLISGQYSSVPTDLAAVLVSTIVLAALASWSFSRTLAQLALPLPHAIIIT